MPNSLPCAVLIFAGACLCAPLAFSQTANRPEALTEAPTDATTSAAVRHLLSSLPAEEHLALVIPRLERLESCLKTHGAHLGNGALPPPIQWLRKRAEIVAGFDEHAPAAVLMSMNMPQLPLPQNLTLWIPTTDRDTLFTFLEPVLQDDGLVRLQIRGRPAFAAPREEYTVIGADAAGLRQVLDAPPGVERDFSPSMIERVAAADLALLWRREGASDALSSGVPDWIPELFAQSSIQSSIVLSSAWTARIGKEGISLELEGILQGRGRRPDVLPAVELPALIGRADEPFIIALAGRPPVHPDTTPRLSRMAISAAARMLLIDPERAVELARRVDALSTPLISHAFTLSLDGGQTETLSATLLLKTTATQLQANSDLESLVSLLRRGPFADPRVNRLWEKAEFRNAAETIDDVVVGHLALNAGEGNRIALETTTRLFGQQGFVLRMGWIAPDSLLITLGGGSERFASAMRSIRDSRSSLKENQLIAPLASRLPLARNMEGYVSIARLIRAVGLAAGEEVEPADAAAPVAPAAFAGIDSDAGALRVSAFAPLESLAYLLNLQYQSGR